MSYKLKNYFTIFFVIIFISIFPKTAFAQVVINEFSSNSDPEWVELFNTSTTQTIDLTAWQLTDANDASLALNGCISPIGFRAFSRSGGWLNNTGGDTVNLKNNAGEISDQVAYGDGGIVGIPPNGKSAGRDPDGSSNWRLFDVPSQTNIDCQLPTTIPTPTLSSTPIPSLTLTPTPVQKAIYKINKAKDNGGNELSSVNIYVDGLYIHHQDDEILNFCDNCHCDPDNNVDCGFGQHTVRTEKDGYENWQETKTFNAGDSYEVNPVMARIVPSSTPAPTTTSVPTSAPTPTPTIKPSLTPTKTPTPSLSLTATPSGEVLGEEIASGSGLSQLSSEENKTASLSEKSENKRNLIFPAVAAVLGLAFIGFSIFSFLKGRRQKEEPEEVVV